MRYTLNCRTCGQPLTISDPAFDSLCSRCCGNYPYFEHGPFEYFGATLMMLQLDARKVQWLAWSHDDGPLHRHLAMPDDGFGDLLYVQALHEAIYSLFGERRHWVPVWE